MVPTAKVQLGPTLGNISYDIIMYYYNPYNATYRPQRPVKAYYYRVPVI